MHDKCKEHQPISQEGRLREGVCQAWQAQEAPRLLPQPGAQQARAGLAVGYGSPRKTCQSEPDIPGSSPNGIPTIFQEAAATEGLKKMQHSPCGRRKDSAGMGRWDLQLWAWDAGMAPGRLPGGFCPLHPRSRELRTAPQPEPRLSPRPGKVPGKGSRALRSYLLPYLAPGEPWGGGAVGSGRQGSRLRAAHWRDCARH